MSKELNYAAGAVKDFKQNLQRLNGVEIDNLMTEEANKELTYREVCDAVAKRNQAKRTQNGSRSTQIGGDHYQKAIQPWDYMESCMSEEAFKGYLWGNIIKYVSRWEDKGGVQDLQKARHYIDKLVSVL